MSAVSRILKKPLTSTIISILLGFVVAAILLAVAGYSPTESFAALFQGVFSRPNYISNTIIRAAPIILTGISVAFAFKTGMFNIGAEGQYIAGTVCAVIAGVTFDFPAPIQIPLVVLAGVAGGAVIGAITGFLKAKFGVHEVITSIMLNWVMLYLNNYVVASDTFHRPDTTSTYVINESSYTMLLPQWKTSDAGQAFLGEHPILQQILGRTDVNIAIIVAIVIAIVIWFVLYHSKFGFELRAVGFNRDAAEFAGINVTRNTLLAMTISGAISGLAGALVITGTSPHCISTLAAFENYGFNGFSVALIAGSSPIGCIFAGLLFGGLIYGGQNVQLVTGAPSDIIDIMIGTIVFFVALSIVIPKIADWLERRHTTKELEAAEAANQPSGGESHA